MRISCRFVAALALGISAQAQDSDAQWQRLGALRPSQRITAELADGRRLRGSFERVDQDALYLRAAAAPLSRGSVRRVTVKSRARGALYGLLIGFGAGFATGAIGGPYIVDYGSPSASTRAKYGLGWGMFFGGVGAGVGALTGAPATVYRRR